MRARNRLSIIGAVALVLVASSGFFTCAAMAAPGGDPPPGAQGAAGRHQFARPHPLLLPSASKCAAVQAKLRAHPAENPKRTSCTEVKPGSKLPTRSGASPSGTKPSAASPAADAFWCESLTPNEWWIEREGECLIAPVDYTLYDNDGNIIGTADFISRDQIELSPTSLDFDEFMEMELVTQRNAAVGLSVAWTSNCELCTDPASGAQPYSASPWQGAAPLLPKEKVDGSVGWSDHAVQCDDPEGDCLPVDRGQIHTTITVLQPDAVPFQDAGHVSYPIRCDMEVQAYTGCVVPDAIPTLEVRSDTYGASAAMVGWAQTTLTAGWGLEGKGQPLHRIADDNIANGNRDIICDSTFKPVDPPVETDSCDEYPFAGTEESGGAKDANGVPRVASGAQCAQVTAVEGDPNGALMFRWPTVQPLATPTGSEPCVRGHIPLLLNTGVGGEYGRFVQRAHVFDGEAFWVKAD